jgi:hypothetical protein
MNPRQVNSENIVQFGFKSIATIETRKILFDITGLTVFGPGGDALVGGIWFEIVDPSGVTIHTVDYAARPNGDIDPNVSSSVELDLPSGLSLFGYYNIKGVIRDADGKTYEAVLPAKRICEPAGYSKGVAVGSFEAIVNCDVPNIIIKENTNLSYDRKSPYVVSKDGRVYYPDGTLANFPFTFTPFEIADVYTGTYTIRNKTLATYDMGDLFYVNVAYATTKEFKVQCGSRIIEIACCIEKIQNEMDSNCDNAIGKAAREMLNRITIPLLMATAKEKAGKDASEEIELIKKVLGCDCECDPQIAEGSPIGAGSGGSFVFEQDCATTLETSVVGNTTHVKYKTKSVTVGKADGLDLAFKIVNVVTDCGNAYNLLFDYKVLAETIYTTTGGDDTLKALFNNLVTSLNLQQAIANVNGSCIIDTTKTDYTLTEDVMNTAPKLFAWIVIDGNQQLAPNGMLLTNTVGMQAYLNSLNKGIWSVSSTGIPGGQRILIQSMQNGYAFSTMFFTLVSNPFGPGYNRMFVATKKTLEQVLQAIIDYLCAIDLADIDLGIPLKVCTITNNGTIQTTNYGPSNSLQTYLEALSTAFCLVVNRIATLAKPTCEDIKSIYKDSAAAFGDTDMLHGTRGGVCAPVSVNQLWSQMCSFLKVNEDARKCLAQIFCVGGTEECPQIQDYSYTLTLE